MLKVFKSRFNGFYLYITFLSVGNVGNDLFVDIDTLQKGIGMKELVVIMQQDRSVVHG